MSKWKWRKEMLRKIWGYNPLPVWSLSASNWLMRLKLTWKVLVTL